MNALAASLIALSGDDNVVVVRKPLVKFTGCLEAGMMFNQLLYWTPRSTMGGWIAKSDKEFGDELCLTQYSTRKARNAMEKMGILETKIKKFKGSPTIHYRLNLDVLEQQWSDFVNSQPVLLNSQEPSIETERTITETTPEITAQDTEPDGSDSFESADDHRAVFSALCKICHVDTSVLSQKRRGILNTTTRRLRESGKDCAKIRAFGVWWYNHDWRGTKGQPPEPGQICDSWGTFEQWKPGQNGSESPMSANMEFFQRMIQEGEQGGN